MTTKQNNTYKKSVCMSNKDRVKALIKERQDWSEEVSLGFLSEEITFINDDGLIYLTELRRLKIEDLNLRELNEVLVFLNNCSYLIIHPDSFTIYVS